MIKNAFISNKGGRSYNEDSVKACSCGDDAYCIVLADGLGGHGGGDLASRAVCHTVCEGWSGEISASEAERLLTDAHEAVHALQKDGARMKSTGVILLASSDKAAWGHVGDSRLYWFTGGELKMQTLDHSASQAAVYMGRITPDKIRFHEDRSRLMKALGQEGAVLPETDETHLLSGQHCFLLCSDGFWEYVLEEEMSETLLASADPREWLMRMEAILSKRALNDNDNYSAIAVWL